MNVTAFNKEGTVSKEEKSRHRSSMAVCHGHKEMDGNCQDTNMPPWLSSDCEIKKRRKRRERRIKITIMHHNLKCHFITSHLLPNDNHQSCVI